MAQFWTVLMLYLYFKLLELNFTTLHPFKIQVITGVGIAGVFIITFLAGRASR